MIYVACFAIAVYAAMILILFCRQSFVWARRNIGICGMVIAAGFLHSMATKQKPTISLQSETATNLVFHCNCDTNLIGEAAYFTYKKTYDDTWYIISPTFFVPSTNFDHTINGCYIGEGKDRKFKLVIEKETSNEVVR